jgi:N-acylglucosamine-6-phosphate 2-epimerase
MALAAAQGGAAAIRANSVVDIDAIRQQVSLPVIGIIKRDYPDSAVFITATLREVDELMALFHRGPHRGRFCCHCFARFK